MVDPTLEEDLSSPSKPWALAPLISTMPYFAHRKVSADVETIQPPTLSVVEEDVTTLNVANAHPKQSSERRAYFKDPKNRQAITFDRDVRDS